MFKVGDRVKFNGLPAYWWSDGTRHPWEKINIKIVYTITHIVQELNRDGSIEVIHYLDNVAYCFYYNQLKLAEVRKLKKVSIKNYTLTKA